MSRGAETLSDTWLTANLADVGELVGAAEIQAMLGGLSRQRVQQLVSAPDFPEPIAVLKAGKVWRTADVVKWAEEKGREIRE